MRIKMTVAYNGAFFFGSQKQTNVKTVNGTIENALHELNITSSLQAAGRTDRGVHATNQVLHIDIPPFWSDIKKLQTSLNYKLDKYIYVKKIQIVSDLFHARYSAKSRTYRYILKDIKYKNPFEEDFVTYVSDINLDSIQKHIKYFIGSHDFSNFTKKNLHTTNTVRTIYKTFAYKHKNAIVLHFRANGFLRSQIRMMTSALIKVEHNLISVQQLKNAISCQYKCQFDAISPSGLYLCQIQY